MKDLEYQAEMLVHKIKHYLITTMGVTVEEANDEEFYRAFSLTLREEIMINWTATIHTYKNKKSRILYYICMEYMPGRLIGNNITNIGASDLMEEVMKKIGKNLESVLRYEPDPGIGNGGLGRLASCFLDSLATQEYPAIAYGLRYQYGIFDQEIWNGKQVERPDVWLRHQNPWEFRRDRHAVSVNYGGYAESHVNEKGVEVDRLAESEEIRALPYDMPIIGYKEGGDFSVATLRLWSTKESPRNFELQRYNAGQLDQAAENTSLTDVLYPNDNHENGKRVQLKQEFLLSSASIQDIIAQHLRRFPDMSNFADKVRIQLNDTHPALLISELMHILLYRFNWSWEESWKTVTTCCNFTNHTLLKEAMEEWNENRLESLFPCHYKIIQRINQQLCNEIREKYPNDEEKVRSMSIIEGGQIRMAHLAIYGTFRTNGVAALHTDILKNYIFSDFYEMYPNKFINVTNGVTQRRWLLHCNPLLSEFISNRIGKKWITDFNEIKKLAEYANDSNAQEEFLAIKKENKEALVHFLQESNFLRDGKGNILHPVPLLGSDALFEVQIKRFHEYKRQFMNILHVLMLYQDLKENIDARPIKRMVLFGGKAAPGYEVAKNVILLINAVARKIASDPAIAKKLAVVFVENYNVSRAEMMIPAVDLSVQISAAGWEASGTGNMKQSMNGALTIGTADGANVEMAAAVGDNWWPFCFGGSAEENVEMDRNRSYNPHEVYTHNDKIKGVIDLLKNHGLAESEEEHAAFCSLFYTLLESERPDRYFVLKDLAHYYEVQKQVEKLYLEPKKWAEYALHNIASMGRFSTDESIHNYAKLAWDLEKCPVDHKELAKVRQDYSEHDKCRILKAG